MSTAATSSSSGRSIAQPITEQHKRWIVFGVALSNVLVPKLLSFVEQEVQQEYTNLKLSHNVHNQSASGHIKSWPNRLNYVNINGNDALPKLRGKYDYFNFDYNVRSHVDFAKLYLENHMAKFNAFDDTCDASAVLTLLVKVPVFCNTVQTEAGNVKQARNSWAHCLFSDWDEAHFQQRFDSMKQLASDVGISSADKTDLLNDLNDWESKGVQLCMNVTVDPDLMKLVQEHVNSLKNDVSKLAFENEEEEEKRRKTESALTNILFSLEELNERFSKVETKCDELQSEVKELKSQQENFQQLVNEPCSTPKISYEFADCETDIKYLMERYDPNTRKWLVDDFDEWFRAVGDSRAYVLLGDAAVGKSVIAAVLAQRAKNDGYLAAAYFCRHNDGTRNNPRYLLGTIAHELCNNNAYYSKLVGGDSGIQSMLANSKANVNELFTKLLQEPLGRCAFMQRKLVVIDALDESEHSSRDDFLDLIMDRFPSLPKWLVFFITSRPEDTVQFRLKTYNPCIRICAGNSDNPKFYEQHEQDIKRFLENKLDFSILPYSVEDITKTCNGMFLYAFYIVQDILRNQVPSSSRVQLVDIFPDDINVFFNRNFKRIFDKVGEVLYKKLFGCVLVAPAPLPLSFISFFLQDENSNIDKQQVIDAVSQFVLLRTSDQTFTFLHDLIPVWLTDEQKARRLFIDRNSEAAGYFKNIIAKLLSDFFKEKSLPSNCKRDLFNYVLRVGVRFLCEHNGTLDVIYRCLTSYQFIQQRIEMSKFEIYYFVKDVELCLQYYNEALDDCQKEILRELCSLLEGESHVLLLYPSLLHSCLRNHASNLVQTKVTIADREASLKSVDISHPVFCTLPIDMKYIAISADKTLLACVHNIYITLFSTFSYEKVGSFEVAEHASITHLEFSPDGKFLFFGRLDRWFSVHRKCVEDIPQFSRNSRLYKWGSFILDGRYIVVEKTCRGKHNIKCLMNIFDNLAMKQDLARIGSMLCKYSPEYRYSNVDSCEACSRSCERRLKYIHQYIIEIYADIFTYQVWNVESGRAILEDAVSTNTMFSNLNVSREIESFISFCDFDNELSCVDFAQIMRSQDFLPRGARKNLRRTRKSLTEENEVPIFSGGQKFFQGRAAPPYPPSGYAYDLAMVNLIIWILRKRNLYFRERDILENFTEQLVEYASPKNNFSLSQSFCPQNVPVELHNHIHATTDLSQDRKWLAKQQYSDNNVELFENTGQHPKEPTPVYSIQDIIKFSFTSDNSGFLYLLKDSSLYLLCLKTGMKLLSVSGVHPIYVLGREIGFIFRGEDKEKKILLVKDLPTKFLQLMVPTAKILTFTSNETVAFVCSDGSFMSFKTGDNEHRGLKIYKPTSRDIHIRKCMFSEDGKLFAVPQGSSSNVLLFKNDSFFPSALEFKHDQCLLPREIEFIFRGEDEEKKILLATDLSTKFLQLMVPAVKVTFTSNETVAFVCSDGSFVSFKIGDNDHPGQEIYKPTSHDIHIRECTFSEDGKLFAAPLGSSILLFKDGKFLSSILKIKQDQRFSSQVFSPDSSIFLCCIQTNDETYVWDVQNEKISQLQLIMHEIRQVECCCISPDNTKLIFCGNSLIEIWEYPVCSERPIRTLQAPSQDNTFKFTHCAVLSNNELLVCCIANNIIIYGLDTYSEMFLPHGHAGRVEFCRFLKGNNYLLSYGVDNIVFLFDLSVQKAISYLRIACGNEYIVNMTVSPNEDKAVCLTSSGGLKFMNLSGLEAKKPFQFPLLRPIKFQTQLTRLHPFDSEIGMVKETHELSSSSSASDSYDDDEESVGEWMLHEMCSTECKNDIFI